MLSYVEKPRLWLYRALLSYSQPDLEFIKGAFIHFALFVEYLIFRRENLYTYEKEWKAVKASKRGNDVYAWRLNKRLKPLKSLPKLQFFSQKNRSKRHKTKILFITLTYRRDIRLDIAWESVGLDFNRWISGLRRKFGKIHVLRAWEAQRDGNPHIHCVLYFEEYEFQTFFYHGKWRINLKKEIARNWHWGFSDIFALHSLGAGVGYVIKYLTKVHDALLQEKYDDHSVLTLAMMWIFRKRAYSISRGFEHLSDDEEQDEKRTITGQVDLKGDPIYRWFLVGFWAGSLDVWYKKLSYREFFSMYSSSSFTKRFKDGKWA